MVEILLFMGPIFLSLLIHNAIYSKDKKGSDLLILFGTYFCLVNVCTLMVLSLYSTGDFFLYENTDRLDFAARYLSLNLVFSVLVPIAIAFINKNFTFKLDFRKIENAKKGKK